MGAVRLPTQDSSTGRAVKTFVQAIIGFVVGLLVTVWAVPGVPHAVLDYLQKNFLQIALLFGVPSGLSSFIWNWLRSDVKNY